MGNILLLYDTTEKDLARDFKELLAELDLAAMMIPLSADIGKTLQAKEEHYFDSVEGIVFLITPGSERMGKLFPSPSVADEMGQAKQKFKSVPEKVIYLVDKTCTIQAVDQKSYIQFNRQDIRSILEAITLLIKNLKQAGLLRKKNIEHREIPGVNIKVYSESINSNLKEICFDLSDQLNGSISFSDFDNLLKSKHRMNNRDVNFAKRDLLTKGLVNYYPPKLPSYSGGWCLSSLGFELVRCELTKMRQSRASGLLGLLDQINKPQYNPPQYPTLPRGLQPKETPLGLKAGLKKKI